MQDPIWGWGVTRVEGRRRTVGTGDASREECGVRWGAQSQALNGPDF